MKKIKEPTIEAQQKLNSVVENERDIYCIRRKQYKIGWMRNGTIRKVSRIMLKEKKEDKVSCKCAAAIILNGFWAIRFWWWFMWRWFYYINQYTDPDLTDIIAAFKKKIAVESYYANTISLTGAMDTAMMMTRKEVRNFRQEHSSAQPQISEKKKSG